MAGSTANHKSFKRGPHKGTKVFVPSAILRANPGMGADELWKAGKIAAPERDVLPANTSTPKEFDFGRPATPAEIAGETGSALFQLPPAAVTDKIAQEQAAIAAKAQAAVQSGKSPSLKTVGALVPKSTYDALSPAERKRVARLAKQDSAKLVQRLRALRKDFNNLAKSTAAVTVKAAKVALQITASAAIVSAAAGGGVAPALALVTLAALVK